MTRASGAGWPAPTVSRPARASRSLASRRCRRGAQRRPPRRRRGARGAPRGALPDDARRPPRRPSSAARLARRTSATWRRRATSRRDQAALGAVVDVLLSAGASPSSLAADTRRPTATRSATSTTADPSSPQLGRPRRCPRLAAGPAGEALGHSGSPFRQAAAHPSGGLRRYTVAGLHPWRVAATHAAFVAAHGRAVWLDDLDDAAVDALPPTSPRRPSSRSTSTRSTRPAA